MAAATGSSLEAIGSQEPDVFETEGNVTDFVEGPASTSEEAVYDDIDASKVPAELDPAKSSLTYQSVEAGKGVAQGKRGDAVTIPGQQVNAERAFKKASRDAKKLLETTSVDFSGGYLGEQRFFVDQSEYALAGDGQEESLEEKYNRLKIEITGFLGEVAAAEKAQSTDSAADNTVTVAMAKDMQFLSQQLQQVKIDKIVGAGNMGVPSSYQTDLTNRLLGNLNTLKQSEPAAAADGSKGDGSGQVVYELFYRPEESKMSDVAKAGKLEERIARLEKVLGSEDVAPLAAELEQQDPSVHSALIALTERISTLSEENTADLTQRLTAVIELAAKAESKSAAGAGAAKDADDAEYAEKVKELYEIGKKCDSMATAVPGVIERLLALKTLHEQGADFGRTLTQLESTQGQLATSVADETAMLTKVEASLKENLAKLEANFKAVDARMEALGNA